MTGTRNPESISKKVGSMLGIFVIAIGMGLSVFNFYPLHNAWRNGAKISAAFLVSGTRRVRIAATCYASFNSEEKVIPPDLVPATNSV